MKANSGNTPQRPYEFHLGLAELSLPPGCEWAPKTSTWSLVQVGSGTGYLLRRESNRELEAGAVLLFSSQSPGSIRASQLGGMSLACFNVDPERLAGVLTLSEQTFLEAAAAKEEFSLQVFPAASAVAGRMKELCAHSSRSGLCVRLSFLQLFFDVFGDGLGLASSAPEPVPGAKERLREFLDQTPASELLHLSFGELVRVTRCTPRHLSRVFQEIVGMSFREKRAELRLARARELLATTQSKVVNVALESGYQSLSLFNLMFARRFGMSPGKWRQKYHPAGSRPHRRDSSRGAGTSPVLGAKPAHRDPVADGARWDDRPVAVL